MITKDPINAGLDKFGLSDAAIGRIFGVTRQSVGQWRKYSSIPRQFQRTFEVLTGVTVEKQCAYAEAKHGVVFIAFAQAARQRLREERGY